MRVVQMTLHESLLATIDRTVKKYKTTRSAFTRTALEHEIERLKTIEREKKQIAGYTRHPVTPGEFSDWESEQAWGD